VAAKKKKNPYLKIFVWVSIVCALMMTAYLVILWWPERQTRFVTYREFGIPIPADYSIHGIDVSRYQRNISWESVSNMNVNGIQLGFVFIKATEGSSNKDPYFKRNWKKAKEAGMTRGAYHFFTSWKDGRLQAEHFIKNVSLESGDLPPVLDIEYLGRTRPAKMREEIKKFIAIIEQHYKVKPIIYTNADFYKQHLQGHLDEYPLWVAHYLQPHKPRITRDWSFWQHSESGKVNGIMSNVDFNVFNGDSVTFRSLLVP
jgi:lysozyme